MHSPSSSDMVHQGERNVAECGPVANWMEVADELLGLMFVCHLILRIIVGSARSILEGVDDKN